MPSPQLADGRTRLAKLKPTGKAGKLSSSASSPGLASGDIDWRVFGLELDLVHGSGPNASLGAGNTKKPSAQPPGPRIGSSALPPGRRSPQTGVRLESIDAARSGPQQAFDSLDLSHLKSSTKRTPGYTLALPPLSKLLEERGVDYSLPNPDRDVQLPLEAFEDTTMWTRTPEEWQQLMYNPHTGAPTPLACKALNVHEDGSGRWQNAVVTGWDAENQRYAVKWSSGQEDKVLSVHVFFDGDDPVLFADRLSKALKQRRYANSLLKYHFFIDSMPEDRSRKIGRESAAKIARMAKTGVQLDASNNSSNSTNNNHLSESSEKLDRKLEQLMEEAQRAYVRVQNAITFEKVHGQGTLGVLPIDLELPPPRPPQEVPYLAVKVLPTWEAGPDGQRAAPDPQVPRGFRQAFEWFCKASSLIRPEVCAALQVTRSMCLDLLTERVFETHFTTPLRLQEFTEREDASIMRLKGRLGMWVNTIRMRITQCLQQATVKWFHLNETSLESYRASRLRPLLVCARLMMSNAFLLLGEDNLLSYVQALESLVPARIEIPGEPDGLRKVKNIFLDAKEESGERVIEPFFKQTLFRLDLQAADVPAAPTEPPKPPAQEEKAKKGGKGAGSGKQEDAQPPPLPPPTLHFELSTKPEDIRRAVLVAFEKGVLAFQDVHSVESVLLPHLIRDDHLDPNFRETDPWVQAIRQRVEAACDVQEPWLERVLSIAEQFKDVVLLDPDERVSKLREGDPQPPAAVRQIIEDRQRRQAELCEAFPDEREPIPVGFYRIDTSSLKAQLSEKLELSVQLLLKYLAEQLDANIQEATASFSDIFAKLKQEVSSIEECSDMREYIKSIPGELSKLQGGINDAMALTSLVEDLRYFLPSETLDARWEMFGTPGNVKARIIKVEEYLDTKHKEFLGKQEGEQKDFERRLSDLERVIEDFGQHDDISQVRDMAEKVRVTNEEIKQCQELVRLFNSREVLFDCDPTDYSALANMVKTFEPYSNLWKTAGDWVKNKDSWLKGAFDQVDPRYCEAEVTGGIRLLFKTIQTLKESEDSKAICAIAERIKSELEEFQPYLPLVTSLRNEGMRDRHWEQISQTCGVKVGPHMEGGFTLRRLLDVGLLNYVNEVSEVGDRAGKEFQLETTPQAPRASPASIPSNVLD